jgi:hypothetical protein
MSWGHLWHKAWCLSMERMIPGVRPRGSPRTPPRRSRPSRRLVHRLPPWGHGVCSTCPSAHPTWCWHLCRVWDRVIGNSSAREPASTAVHVHSGTEKDKMCECLHLLAVVAICRSSSGRRSCPFLSPRVARRKIRSLMASAARTCWVLAGVASPP